MNCYYHRSIQAVGVCKNCQKGLCEDCAADVGNGLACKDKCERQVKAINELVHHNQRTLGHWGPAYMRNAIVFGLLGLAMILFAIFQFAAGSVTVAVAVSLLSLLFLYAAIMNRNESNRYKARERSD